MSDISTTPAGWYPDPSVPGQSRWWDGAQWTEQVQQPYDPARPAIELRAPEGTKPYTAWIWVITLLPILEQSRLLFIDYAGIAEQALNSRYSGTGTSSVMLATSPSNLPLTLLGWLIYGLVVLFAYFDWRALRQRGVPRPFHWAWTFLYSPVYVIGRSVVVRRRTGSGIAPMWVTIAGIGLSVVAVIYVVVVTMSAVFQLMPSYVSN